MEYYLVVDIGTSSVRVTIVDELLHTLSTQTQKRIAETCLDAEAEWLLVKALMRKATQAAQGAHKISGVAVSALMGWIGVDANRRAVTACYTYMHRENAMGHAFQAVHTDDEIYPICGIRINAEWAAFKLQRLMQQEPSVYHEIKRFLSLKDFIAMKLTGEIAMDHTTASYTMLYDIKARTWSSRVAGWLGVNCEKLPQLKYPFELLGAILPDVALELGLAGGLPVTVGSVDGSTGIFGASPVNAHRGVSVMGTTDVLYVMTDEARFDPGKNLVVKPHILPGLWMVGGPMGSFGGTIDWLMHNIANDSLTFQDLTQLAAAVPPGCDGVTAYPSLEGERAPFWNPDMAGGITGLKRKHGIAHICRAILEANGYLTKVMIDATERVGTRVDGMIAIGGGSQNDLWLQIKADITGKPHYRSDIRETTTIGSALLIQMANGKSVQALPTAPTGAVFFPEEKTRVAYGICYEKYLCQHKIISKLYG